MTKFRELTPLQQRLLLRAVTGHILAIAYGAAFLIIVLVALLGQVNLSDPAATAFVGGAIGYVAAQMQNYGNFYWPMTKDQLDAIREMREGTKPGEDDPPPAA